MYGRRRSYKNSRRRVARKGRSTKGKRVSRRGYRKVGGKRTKWHPPICRQSFLKFVYADSGFSVTMSAIGGYIADYVFRGNSPYDPDYTGVGVQPYGWDQMMGPPMFDLYRAPSSSIRAYFRPTSECRRLHCLLIPYGSASISTSDISDLRMVTNHRETTYDSEQENTRGAMIKGYAKTSTLFRHCSDKDVSFVAAYNANPTTMWYWHLIFYTDEYTVETFQIYFDVKIKYYVKAVRSASLPNES